ncbi:alpha/beta hydrolase domain-containing protein 17C-like [Stegodyphus dumicola]|uniref:alpha/beta hydrolase domain-containing protein 17C-like n=1 Tax=Stegodyphus dumicola TaxID=202533 RepID=UPI0015B34D1E|nr:alpha/beta hydrolase domain-containing protein 17C-like [Stegodyphus dumicola]
MSSVKRISSWNLIKFLCCPPCPRNIAEKVAFMPPSPPSYEIVSLDERPSEIILKISLEIEGNYLKNVLRYDVRFVKTLLKNDIVVLYIKCVEKAPFTIIYSHGNAVDVGLILSACINLSLCVKCDVVTYDYSGYGQSKGKPSETNLNADIRAALDYTLNIHEPNLEKIILYGQSLGTVPTLNLASQVSCAGVILHAPMTSALQVACGEQRCCRCWDSFNKYVFLSN